MSLNESFRFAVIAIVLTLLCSLSLLPMGGCDAHPAPRTRPRVRTPLVRQDHNHQQQLMCSDQNKSFWIRNQCLDGFLTVIQRRILSQFEGLDRHSAEVEIVKETCKDVSHKSFSSSSSISIPVMVRLRHVKSESYICFNRRGKVKAMSKRRADKLGKLCAFYELPFKHHTSDDLDLDLDLETGHHDGPYYVQYRSAYKKRWLLGFNGRKRRIARTRLGFGVSLPRPMLDRHRRLKKVRPNRCDFKFATGEYHNQDLNEEWRGLFDHLSNSQGRHLLTNNRVVNNVLNSEVEDEDDDDDDQDEDEDHISSAAAASAPSQSRLDKTMMKSEETLDPPNSVDEQEEKARSPFLQDVEQMSLVPDISSLFWSEPFPRPLVAISKKRN